MTVDKVVCDGGVVQREGDGVERGHSVPPALVAASEFICEPTQVPWLRAVSLFLSRPKQNAVQVVLCEPITTREVFCIVAEAAREGDSTIVPLLDENSVIGNRVP